MKKKYTVNGKEYTSLQAACDAANVSCPTLRKFQAYRQVSVQEALDLYVKEKDSFRKKSRSEIVYQGTTFKTLTAACKAAKISAPSVAFYVRAHGLSPQKAFDLYVENGGKAPRDTTRVEHCGTKYANLKVACDTLCLSYSAVRAFKYKHDVTAQEALNHYLAATS